MTRSDFHKINVLSHCISKFANKHSRKYFPIQLKIINSITVSMTLYTFAKKYLNRKSNSNARCNKKGMFKDFKSFNSLQIFTCTRI